MAVIAGIIAVIGIVFALPVKPWDIPPEIADSVKIGDDTSLNIGKISQDVPSIQSTADIKNQSDSGFSIDEKGLKHFVISAEDKPLLTP